MAAMGLKSQILDPAIRPLGAARMCGPAVCAAGQKKGGAETLPTFQLDQAVTPGSIVVISTDQCRTGAIVGENMIASMTNNGARGFILDGAVRDSDVLSSLATPVWCGFRTPASAHADWAYISVNTPIELPGLLNSVSVSNGDFVLTDADGVCIIPHAHAAQIISDAERLLAADVAIAAALETGVDREVATKDNPRIAHIRRISDETAGPTE